MAAPGGGGAGKGEVATSAHVKMNVAPGLKLQPPRLPVVCAQSDWPLPVFPSITGADEISARMNPEDWQIVGFTAWVSALSTLVILPLGLP